MACATRIAHLYAAFSSDDGYLLMPEMRNTVSAFQPGEGLPLGGGPFCAVRYTLFQGTEAFTPFPIKTNSKGADLCQEKNITAC